MHGLGVEGVFGEGGGGVGYEDDSALETVSRRREGKRRYTRLGTQNGKGDGKGEEKGGSGDIVVVRLIAPTKKRRRWWCPVLTPPFGLRANEDFKEVKEKGKVNFLHKKAKNNS